MPAVVTFDPTNLWIVEVDTAADTNEVNLVEIYSEWKDWLLADPTRLGYPPAFRPVGGDPVDDVNNLAITYFLNVNDGWRLKPAEYDHQWQINGNIFTDPAGLRRTVPTDGAYTVEVTFNVSTLPESSVNSVLLSSLELAAFNGAVTIDVVNGTAGTGWPLGTAVAPSGNLADALTIAGNRGLPRLMIVGDLVVSSPVEGFEVIGAGSHINHRLTLQAGVSVANSLFSCVVLEGTQVGEIDARDSRIEGVTGLSGFYGRCGFRGTSLLADDSEFITHKCFSEIPFTKAPVFQMGSGSGIQMRGWNGAIELQTFTAGNEGSLDCDGGLILINENCTGGDLSIRGQGTIQRAENATVNISAEGFVRGGHRNYGVFGLERDTIQELNTDAVVVTANSPDIPGLDRIEWTVESLGALTHLDPVDLWTDSGVTGIDVTGTGTTRPIFRTDGALGNTVRFDGIDDVMESGIVAGLDLSGGVHVFVVGARASFVNSAGLFQARSTGGSAANTTLEYYENASNQLNLIANRLTSLRGTRMTDAAVDTTTPILMDARLVDGMSLTDAQHVDAVAKTPVSLGLGNYAPETPINEWFLGAGAGGVTWDGDIYAIVLYFGRIMTAAEQSSVRASLNTRFAVY